MKRGKSKRINRKNEEGRRNFFERNANDQYEYSGNRKTANRIKKEENYES